MSYPPYYSDQMVNDFWADLCAGYWNYGRMAPDADVDNIPDLKKANEDMVEYIISSQGIGPGSRILDLGCGKGMYTVRIAKHTGCQFVGVDINSAYIEECTELAKSEGVGAQGEFLTSSILELDPVVKEKKYTHILVLGVMLYTHGALDSFLGHLIGCCDQSTKVFIWDLVRNADWEKLREANRYLSLPHSILTKDEVLVEFKRAGLDLVDYEDATKYILPACKIQERECKKRDPNMEVLLNPLVCHAFEEGLLGYVYYTLRLKSSN